MRKPNTPKKPFALSIRWQLMLFIGGITLFTLLLVWGIITYALAPQYNRNIRNKLDAKAAAITALQQFNFTKAFIGANGVALNVGFTTPDPEEAAVKAVAVRRARETWYLVDDSKFGRVYPAVIGEIYSGAILTNRCPDPKYRQLTLVKETEQ